MPYIVKIPQFEGPLDQLLTLAQQGQVDLREIPLAHIAEAYLAGTEHKVDLEEATEVLWMLAAMIEMKSRLLVPKPQTPAEPLPVEEEPSDLEARLEEKLQEYRALRKWPPPCGRWRTTSTVSLPAPPETTPTRCFWKASHWMTSSAHSSRCWSARGKR